MKLIVRRGRERVIQTLLYEAGGVLLFFPLFGLVSTGDLRQSLLLLFLLCLAAATWAYTYNTLFDRIEQRKTGRLASDRRPGWRVVHAIGFEASLTLVSCPIIHVVAGMSWMDALKADLVLTLGYTVYDYLFHWLFDRWRPIRAGTRVPLVRQPAID